VHLNYAWNFDGGSYVTRVGGLELGYSRHHQATRGFGCFPSQCDGQQVLLFKEAGKLRRVLVTNIFVLADLSKTQCRAYDLDLSFGGQVNDSATTRVSVDPISYYIFFLLN
jgi:hypothetical protein